MRAVHAVHGISKNLKNFMSMRKMEDFCRNIQISTTYTVAVVLFMIFAAFGPDTRDCLASDSSILIFDILI